MFENEARINKFVSKISIEDARSAIEHNEGIPIYELERFSKCETSKLDNILSLTVSIFKNCPLVPPVFYMCSSPVPRKISLQNLSYEELDRELSSRLSERINILYH